ncbi:PDZ and LIM domain protein 5a isoform X1 [Salmo salar]|uniref:PDZ and LIM domain protein 5 isoform X1 n=1 Tax=Salmo salar TaxID=8030 RepID=A0A1S3PKQ7_SALSA|nr:PDZ and LIM domain protein 5a isoform X1 [Salmo salar]XP_014027944.1 PDZ and LIM domain protein 5a isoform X1 [Salmo salar]|eukprot:XP_014027943.1 PREDICTED: PDZ and LIM domain protein 5 isoform X1 [Salmo salar]
MSSNYSVSLLGPAPWGFRLQGGKDFNMPLTISRLTDLGKAAKARIAVGDVVLSIDGISTDGMNHLEAQNKIKACAGNLNLTLQRASTIPKPAVAPKPSVYNTPFNLYSNENACEVAMGQRRGLTESQGGAVQLNGGPQSILKATPPKRVPRRPILETDIEFYHVPSHGDASKKRLMEDTEDWRPRSGTTQSRSFRILAQITGTEHQQAQESDAENKTNSSPVQPLTHLSPVSAVQPLLFPKPVRYGNHTNLLYPNVLISVKSAAPFPLFYGCRRELLLNPLEFLPRGGPCPPALTPSAPTLAIRSHSTVIGLQARTPHRSPDGTVSQSLLDALLITPITTLPPLRLRKKKRRSVSALHLPNNKRVSWHQSVTDLGDPNLSSPVNAVYIFSEEVEEPETTSHMSSAVKTMTKGPAGSPNNSITFTTTQGELCSGFPKPGLQTCFGMRGNGTTSVLSKGPVPERPAPQPHPKDQDTLVQMAEHIPAGTRTPMCGHCNMDIRGPFLVAMGKSWHPEEFNCAHCRTSLADIGFVEEQGSVYCEHCYEDFFAPSCSRCQLKILGEVINALKQTWHIHCFLCASCQQPIRNNTFHLEDGEPYCERDYYSLFGTGCHGCEFPIEAGDKFLEALGFTWHDTCFVCVICCTTLEGQAFFSKMDKPLCRKHAHSVVKI